MIKSSQLQQYVSHNMPLGWLDKALHRSCWRSEGAMRRAPRPQLGSRRLTLPYVLPQAFHTGRYTYLTRSWEPPDIALQWFGAIVIVPIILQLSWLQLLAHERGCLYFQSQVQLQLTPVRAVILAILHFFCYLMMIQMYCTKTGVAVCSKAIIELQASEADAVPATLERDWAYTGEICCKNVLYHTFGRKMANGNVFNRTEHLYAVIMR